MSRDEDVHALAARQHAAVARWQLAGVGLDAQWARRRVRAGDWCTAGGRGRVLVRAGAPRTPEQLLHVAVLDAGPGAVASHRSAAWLWGLPGFDLDPLDVLRPRRPGHHRSGRHAPRLWLPHHETEVWAIPCASLPITIFQLAGLPLPVRRMRRLVHTVVGRSPGTLPLLHRTLDEVAERGRPGITTMRTLLDELPIGSRPAGSGAELRFEELLAEAGEPPFERQVDLGGSEWIGRFDHRCPETGLIVEVQSDPFHTAPEDIERDERRRAELLAAGAPEVLFIWDDQIWRRPWEVVPAVRAARARARAVLAARTRHT